MCILIFFYFKSYLDLYVFFYEQVCALLPSVFVTIQVLFLFLENTLWNKINSRFAQRKSTVWVWKMGAHFCSKRSMFAWKTMIFVYEIMTRDHQLMSQHRCCTLNCCEHVWGGSVAIFTFMNLCTQAVFKWRLMELVILWEKSWLLFLFFLSSVLINILNVIQVRPNNCITLIEWVYVFVKVLTEYWSSSVPWRKKYWLATLKN